MVILITGATHTGKTCLAQKLMEKMNYPYVSQDHIKMGLIRSGYTELTPEDDDKLTGYLWPITREMAKTAIENRQNLIIEGCYIPFDWKKDFSDEYLPYISFLCLCMSDAYISYKFDDIRRFSSCIEQRLDDDYCVPEVIIRENKMYREGCINSKLAFEEINADYNESIDKVIEKFCTE